MLRSIQATYSHCLILHVPGLFHIISNYPCSLPYLHIFSPFYHRDGLQESAVISKTFQVDLPPEDFDDGYSFIESFDTMSTTTTNSTSTASTIKHNKKNKHRSHGGHHVSRLLCSISNSVSDQVHNSLLNWWSRWYFQHQRALIAAVASLFPIVKTWFWRYHQEWIFFYFTSTHFSFPATTLSIFMIFHFNTNSK